MQTYVYACDILLYFNIFFEQGISYFCFYFPFPLTVSYPCYAKMGNLNFMKYCQVFISSYCILTGFGFCDCVVPQWSPNTNQCTLNKQQKTMRKTGLLVVFVAHTHTVSCFLSKAIIKSNIF